MSTTYIPRQPDKAAKTSWSYDDGGFDANSDGGQRLGDLHVAFGLPLDPYTHESNMKHWDGEGSERSPFEATADEAASWAKTITRGLRFIEDDDPYKPFFEGWRDFLATCGGYYVTF